MGPGRLPTIDICSWPQTWHEAAYETGTEAIQPAEVDIVFFDTNLYPLGLLHIDSTGRHVDSDGKAT